MVLIHDSVHFTGGNYLWDLGEGLGKQKGLFATNSLCIPRLTIPRQGFLLLLSAMLWFLK